MAEKYIETVKQSRRRWYDLCLSVISSGEPRKYNHHRQALRAITGWRGDFRTCPIAEPVLTQYITDSIVPLWALADWHQEYDPYPGYEELCVPRLSSKEMRKMKPGVYSACVWRRNPHYLKITMRREQPGDKIISKRHTTLLSLHDIRHWPVRMTLNVTEPPHKIWYSEREDGDTDYPTAQTLIFDSCFPAAPTDGGRIVPVVVRAYVFTTKDEDGPPGLDVEYDVRSVSIKWSNPFHARRTNPKPAVSAFDYTGRQLARAAVPLKHITDIYRIGDLDETYLHSAESLVWAQA